MEAADEAKVPKFQDRNRLDQSLEIRKLYKARVAVLQKLRRKDLSDADRQVLNSKLKDIQLQVAATHREEAFEKEKRVAEEIKTNPKRFYQYANSFRKTKAKIGPLKSGDTTGKPHYESGPRRMAQILSAQYKSVFTTPKLQPPPITQRAVES